MKRILYGILDAEIYMKLPDGLKFPEADPIGIFE